MKICKLISYALPDLSVIIFAILIPNCLIISGKKRRKRDLLPLLIKSTGKNHTEDESSDYYAYDDDDDYSTAKNATKSMLILI